MFQGSKIPGTVGLVASLALILAGCTAAPADSDEIGVCIDPKTDQRIEDDECPNGRNGWESENGSVWFWYSTSSGHSAPPIGQKVIRSTGYSGAPTATYHSRGGVPKAGSVISKSTIARGGFGSGSAGKSSGG